MPRGFPNNKRHFNANFKWIAAAAPFKLTKWQNHSVEWVPVMGVSISSRECANKLFIIMHRSVLSTRYGFRKIDRYCFGRSLSKPNMFQIYLPHTLCVPSTRRFHSIAFNSLLLLNRINLFSVFSMSDVFGVVVEGTRATVLFTYFNGHPSADRDRVPYALSAFAALRSEWKQFANFRFSQIKGASCARTADSGHRTLKRNPILDWLKRSVLDAFESKTFVCAKCN